MREDCLHSMGGFGFMLDEKREKRQTGSGAELEK